MIHKEMTCLRCGGEMEYLQRQFLQQGQASFLLGDLPHIWAGGIELDFYRCRECGKMEFFAVEADAPSGLPQQTCPRCGHQHDFDYPRCPACGYDYYGK